MWDNYQLPNSPIIARTSQQSDLNKIEVNGQGLSQAKINQEAEFVIDGSRAGQLQGLPEVCLFLLISFWSTVRQLSSCRTVDQNNKN